MRWLMAVPVQEDYVLIEQSTLTLSSLALDDPGLNSVKDVKDVSKSSQALLMWNSRWF